MLCLNFPGSSPSSFPHSRHPGCLLFTKPGPSPAQGLAFILEKSSRYASGISLFLVPFSSQHRDLPWPPHLEMSMLLYIYLPPHSIFVSSSDQRLTYTFVYGLPTFSLAWELPGQKARFICLLLSLQGLANAHCMCANQAAWPLSSLGAHRWGTCSPGSSRAWGHLPPSVTTSRKQRSVTLVARFSETSSSSQPRAE